MKLRSKGKNAKTSLFGLFNRRKRLSDPLAGGESSITTSSPPNLIVQANMRLATGTSQRTSVVGNAGSVALNDVTYRAVTSILQSDTPNIVGSEYEGWHDGTILQNLGVAPGVYPKSTGGFFDNAHHLILNDPSMVDNSTKIVHQRGDDKGSKAKKLLLKHMIHGAAHDSSARDPPPKCHPGTRIKINERTIAWFYDQMKLELILWIYGPAGVGKSAIVQTFAEALALAKCLGASVFFSRPNGRNNSGSVFITIAYELALRIEEYSAYIGEKLAFDPRLVYASMKEQFRAFIVEPFVEKKVGAGGKTWGVLLDGLDELDERDRQREIIQLITTFAHDHPEVPLAWVISSRPEPHITNTFKQQRLIYNWKEEYVPINSPEACQDVERYLRGSFKTIQQVKFPHIVAAGWPEETQIVKLANAASGLFAFADVAIRFIGDPNYADPITRLDDVLSVIDGCRVGSANDQPFALLDALYTRILTRIPPNMWQTTQRVLGAIVALKERGNIDCVKGLSVVLGLPLSKVYASINDLYSVLGIPPLELVYSRNFYFHHASFNDFLRDTGRSKEFHISEEKAERDVTESNVRVWLEFKRNSTPRPSSGYDDQWSDYASRFHSGANHWADAIRKFNNDLFECIHSSLLISLRERWSTVLREGSQQHWDNLLGLLCQIDAGTACYSFYLTNERVVNLWFGIWHTYQERLRSRGVAREIQLHQVRLDSLEWPEGRQRGCIGVARPDGSIQLWTPESFEEYMSYFEYFQRRCPDREVLICGALGSRFAMFKSEITKADFTALALHSDRLRRFVEHGRVHVYHCFSCSDEV